MNWSDFLVLAIIVLFTFIGLKKGFIISIFDIASFFISAVLSIKLYPKVAEFLNGIGVRSYFQTTIYKGLLTQKDIMVSKMGSSDLSVSVSSFVNDLPVPGIMKNSMIEQIPNSQDIIGINGVLDIVSAELSNVAVSIAALVALFIIIRVCLLIARVLLKGIANLPVLKQLDKAGGLVLGAVEGLLMVYIIFSVIVFFNAWPQYEATFGAIDQSLIAKFFYSNNFIMNWMFH
ncbi:MAG TPA: CvpA family protein [Clostridiaceae bacterium]|nr:CvpA family protein [Clostridiaceae bacterium]